MPDSLKTSQRSSEEAAVFAKITRRLIPLLFGCYILSYLDRVNVGFAKLPMMELPWFSDAVYATGAGIFFLGYFFFEVPGNLILHRVGARIWIARIMIGWGAVSACMAYSHSPSSFYTLRFILGVAEAGFFPGIILYLTYWYPSAYRAKIVALFMTAIAAAGVIGGPISGWILKTTDGWYDYHGWQWLFVLEGIPTIIVGVMIPFILPNGPKYAKWLTQNEKDLVVEALEHDEQTKKAAGNHAHKAIDAFKSAKVWICAAIYFGVIVGLYGSSFWLPQIIKDNLTKDEFFVGLYSAIPWTCAAIAMVWYGGHSDKTGERRWHIAGAAFIGGAGFALSGIPGLSPLVVMIFLTIAIIGVMCAVSCFWALPTRILSGSAAAAGIAWVNSVGNLAGYLSPEMVAFLKRHYNMSIALVGIMLLMWMSGILVLSLQDKSPEEKA